jgi:hypothetical protein
MRMIAFFVAAFSVLSAANAYAQVEMTVPEVGRVKTIAKVENGFLGISNHSHASAGQHANAWAMLLRICHKNQGLDLPRVRLQP